MDDWTDVIGAGKLSAVEVTPDDREGFPRRLVLTRRNNAIHNDVRSIPLPCYPMVKNGLIQRKFQQGGTELRKVFGESCDEILQKLNPALMFP